MRKPATKHMTAVRHLRRYLNGSLDLAFNCNKGQFAIHVFTDASFAGNPDNRRSTTGYVFLLCEAPISYGEKEA